MSFLQITHSRVHNLKNVSVKIPKNKLTVITGLSGSGKSSLAFDTIYAEGQRRYAESLNAYARQFMDVEDKPDVDEITGLSPTIAIDQKNLSQNPRSTVGTATEIYDLLRLLYSRVGKQYCPDCGVLVEKKSLGEIVEAVRKLARGGESLLILAPFITNKPIDKKIFLMRLEQGGYEQARINGVLLKRTELKNYEFVKDKNYSIDLVIGRLTEVKKQNIFKLIDDAVDIGNGVMFLIKEKSKMEIKYSTLPVCPSCGRNFSAIEPRVFSFNSPQGACPRCTGLGYTLDVDFELVIPNARLTLAEGAIQPWTRIVGNQQYYQKLLSAVAATHDFSMDMAVKDLPQAVINIIMYGTDGEEYSVEGKKVHFEGVVPNLTTRHAETKSEYIQREIESYMREKQCPVCMGKRLKQDSLAIKINKLSIAEMSEMTVGDAQKTMTEITQKTGQAKSLDKNQSLIATPIAKEINKRLLNLARVGLSYLSLDRSATTLAGGEAQRVRLSTQLSTGLSDVIYILDEPSIGLHPKDNEKLIGTLRSLRDMGNTVIVVEHDAAMIEAADFVIDMGPGAGENGGEIVAEGTVAEIKKNKQSITGQFLLGKEKIEPPKQAKKGNGKMIEIIGATAFNLKNIDVQIPLAKFVCVTGVSGSGKSTLVSEILSKALHQQLYKAKALPGAHREIKGVDNIDKVITIDQKPIGRTPRSNPATYTGIFTAVRDLFADVAEAKVRGLDAGMFSFNVKGGGRCEACAGEGYIRIPMQFLADVYVECSECDGERYNKEALEIHYRQKNIADILRMSVDEAHEFFRDITTVSEKLAILREVGLGYLKLGQPATNLSGGEAQRIKLATELSRRATGRTLYILDEPTTGLHFADVKRLLDVLRMLVDKGNTVLTIEHNLDVIKSADWIIDLGPEGGKKGGELVAEGTPEQVAKQKRSATGEYLAKVL